MRDAMTILAACAVIFAGWCIQAMVVAAVYGVPVLDALWCGLPE